MSRDPRPTKRHGPAQGGGEGGRSREPIAVVGIGCRFPGARDARAFWRLLRDGVDAVTEVPRERFDVDAVFDPRPGVPGKTYSRWGGFLADVDRFDAGFFGISPREAAGLDPQQRLVLELAWEAFEDAGQVPAELAGSPSGVFLGLGPEDYLARGLRRTSAIDLYLATGGSRGTAAGRVAHAFGLEGPALVVDTDRSASLVAVHLACRSLWSGESSLALAGGVNLVLGPELSIAFAQAGMLARDGRSKPFDARADGFVRSDGSGLVVLKPLAAARASGDRVYAVIRGSAVTSAGGRGELLFAPSRAGQEAVLRAAYRDAGLRPGRVQYVEAHGTGTPLGDRVEAEALGAVMGEGRSPGEACAIGSVKSNVGHCEAAAGIAGLIKAVLSLERRMIPATLHCREPHPEIPWHDLPIVVQERLRPWPAGTARAGVSSFGIAGTHAHVVLEQAPDQPRRAVPPAGPAVLTLSAETPQALADLARSHAGVFRSAEPEQMRDAAYTSAVRRSHFAHRLAAAGSSREELAAALEAFSRGQSHPDLRTGLASAARGPVFVFSGQGSQWCGMGRELLAAEPVFRAALEACDEALRRHRESSLLDQLAAEELPDDDALVQPVLFALQVALAALWRSWGVEPAAVVGQSLGEVAAAQVAGALGLDDAVRVIHHRSRLAGSVAGKGAMATVELPFAEVERALRGREQRLSVAVVASPESTVISGEPAALEALLEELTERGIESRRIRVDYASHSPRVEPLLGELRRELRGIEPGAASVAICSTVTAAPIDGAALDPEYWTRNLRLPVRFGPAIERLIADGHRHFLEISPHPIACTPVLQVLHHGGREGVALPSLRRSQEERPQMLAALGALHAAGCQVDWKRFYSPPGRVVSLPGYPWQRERYWLDDGDPEDNPSGWQGQTTPSPSGWQGQTTPAVGRTTNRSVEMPQASGVSKFALVCPGTEQGQGVPIAEGGGISSHHQRPDELSQALPLPPLEVALRQRVARLLRLPPDQIPADRPLVALGLDSLTATELEYALARQLGASVPARRLLDGLSIETLVRELANAGEPRTPSPRSPLASAGEHPLSDGQRALWFLHRLAPESSAYHVAFAFRVHSRLDRSALSRALDRLTQRHPALRTTFHASQGEPLERLHDQLTAEFVGEAGCLRKEAFRPFDPETGPLLRLGLFQETGGDVLLLVMHHLITDFRSSAMLLRELGLLYRQERGGAPAELLPLPRSYHDFVRHQRELLASAEGERLASYWRRQLAGAPATIELPVDRARPAVASWAGASAVLRFGTRLSQSVRRLAGAESATLFSTLLASFQTLLHRYSGQPQLLVGSPAGRTTDVFDDVVGYFVNPLVLRADFSGDLTFSGFLARIRRTVLDALDHKDYPFPRLVEALEPERDASRSPLFQVMFTFEPTRRPEDELLAACLVGRAGIAHELGALALESMRLPEEASQFDLTLTMAEVEGELAASLVYNTDLFDATTARRLLVHLRNLLAGVAADPGRDLAALPLLSAGERQQLLVEWNATREELASELCLPQLFERQAARTPDAVAVVCGSRQLSYRELNERANGLAHRLHALGIGAEDRVGIRLERSPELVVGVLAVLKAGGAWVPLDPALPEARMAYQRDASGAVPLPNPHPPDPLSQTDPPPARERGRMRGKWRNESAHGDHLAYVIFTSGSTGKPKGVPITHRALVNFLRAMAGRPGLTAADTLLAVTTPSFDIAILELFLPLVCGGRVVVAPREVTADGERLAELLAASGATVMQATPATWRLLIAAGWRGDARLRILCGGEALPRELAGELAARGSALWNLYGPTETTIWSAVERVGSAPESATTSIGRPIANTRIHVLDRRLGPVPVGVPGELMIAGAGLSRGYLGRPGLSAAQFIPDPFSSQPGERLYRTGDRARYRGDGALEYLGRSDHQIKIRGFRIEPGEIETLLAEHPAVHAAVVISHLSPSGGTRAAAAGDERLVAYFVPRPGTAVSATELRRRLEHRLPDYMVPAVFVALPALPLTPSGKVDRQALPAAGGDAGTGAAWVAPRTPVEEILTEIWATILDRRRIGVHDNFFALGGHSLLAVRVLSRVRQALDCELPVRSLFERPTVARFATLVETSGGEASSTPPLVATARPAEIPLSFGQERLWFLDQVLAVRTAYNMPAAVRFRGTLHLSPSGGTLHLSPSGGTPHLSPSGGTLSVAVLERSCREIVHRHEVLRTAFPAPGGRPRQEIAPAAELDLPVVDLAGTTSETRETETRRLMRREVDRPFDLARGPLLRLTLLRLADDDHLLLLSVHHIVFDEWSHGILLRELTELYAAFLDGGSSPLPELAVQYADFALWQRRALGAEVIGPQLAYWRAQLAGIEPCELPPDRPRSAGGSRRSGVGARRFDAELESLRELGLSRGASWFMTLLAAFFTLLHRLTGRRDLVVGTPVAGRNREEIEGLIGFFVNTLVLRARVDGNPCFPEFLDFVRETALGAYARQEVPFERLVDELAPNRELGRNPLFQIMFAVHGEADGRRRLPGLHLDFPKPPWPAAKFDLELHLDEENGAVGAVAVYDRGLFEPTTIDRLTSSLGRVLRRLAERPDTRLGELPLMTSPERHQLLVEWNDRLAGRDPGECLHQLFEAQVSRTPSAVAVACGDRQLSYGELDRRAGALARQLTALGVGPEARIGLCAERSLELVVGLLAVVKAGGAYVPLDPAYPPEHLEFILRDAGITVLLDETRLSERLPATGARVVSLDSAVGPRSGDRPAVATVPGNAAYVIYTSGSTGRPKGVVVTHANAVRLFAATEGWFRFGPGDVWTLFHSYAFDFSVWELWGALLYGGRLEVVPHAVSRAPAEFLRLLEEKGVTVLNQTPSAFRLLMTAEPRQGLALRLVVFGGEALEPRSLRPWFDRHGDGTAPGHGPRLVNMYGITETTVHVTLRPLEAADARGAPSSPIGVALAHLDAVVLDRYQQPLPIGAAGELHLAGAGLARGYLARPALTAARFVPNPFATVAGERLYRTGDLVRRLPDGELEYLGRVDQQIKIRGFRIEPGEIEAVLRRHPAVRDAVVVARENPGGERQLAACVVEERATSDSGLSVGPLREWVERKLPGHMVPALFVFLEALPLTPSGKLDRAALGRRLPSTTERSRLARRYIAPRGPVESALARIWAEVLGVERVGADDNFFELGGDSILSIRIVARANEEGLRLAPRDLFARKTVAGLAAVVGREASIAEQGPITGPVPLTPIQSWFFARRLPEPWHFNQAMLVEQRRPLRPQLLAAAFAELLRHHDALRLRFTPREEGWQQSGVPWDGAVPFVRIDLSRLTPVGQARAYAHAAPQIQASLDLAAGPLLRLVRFEPGRLLMVIHHLAVDAVSWRILLADLDRALRRLAAGRAPAFPPKTTSFKAWAEGLRVYARSEGTRRELDFWRAQERPAPLPVDFAGGDNTLASAATVTVSLDRDETRHLLRRAPAAYRTQINDLLLTALTRALAPWTGDRSLLIDLEGHGREEILPGVDLSRTVGWFTSIFPVLLDPGPDRDEGAQLKTIKEQLRAVPRRGIGFGVLRYLSERLTLGSLARPQLSFNYLGQLDADFSGLTELRPVREEVREEVGPVTGSRGRRSHLVEINAEVAGGRLRMTWTYSRNLHRDATIDGLARRFRVELRGVIAHCLAPEAGGYTPSDFPLARLDQERLDALVGTADVEDVYPLSPLQEGLLFHTLKAPRSTVYFEQLSWTFGDDLDPAALRRAWERVVERHAVLRTAFAWEGLERPLQIVDRQVEVPWEEHDWRRIDDEETRFAALLAADRRRGFDLSRAPLLRFTLVRRADGSWHLVWSHHHLLVDGWSVQLLCEEVGAFYRGDSPSLQRPRPYRDFIAWLGHGDAQQAESFWRRRLRGFAAPTPLPLESAVASASAEPREERLRLPAESSARLAAWTRRHQLTLSTLVQGAMALMLARCAGSDDVVFGVTTSGRDAALPGAEAMVGLLINTLPLRVRLAPQEPLCGWLERLQTEQLEVRRYEHTSLAQVQSWSEVSPPDPLFESILVFENYPRRAQEKDGGPHYDFEATHYPLTVIAIPGRELVLRASYAPARFAATTVARMLRHLALVLEGMASDSGIVLGALPTLSKVERHQLLVEWNDVAACPVGDCVHQRVAARAAAMPEATAVVAGDERLSYRELDRRANDLAHALRRLGAGPETAVGVSLERSPEMAVAVLAIFKAGAACVPLDPAYPRERLAFVLEEIDRAAPGPGLLLTRDRLLTEFPEQLPLSRVGGGSVWERGSGGEGSGSNPAYVIYTSGSTGRPKGVAMTHGALANLVSWQVTRAAERARATTLQFASLSFDVSFQEIFSTWCAGGELVLAGDEVRRDPAALLEVLERHAVERLFLPFVALRELAETAVERQRYPDALRRVITAGEQLQITPALRRFFAKLPHCVLENQYGPVETHVVTAFSLAGATSGWAALPPIGRPIASTELVVAGSDLRPVPLGVAGELFLGGAGLARGYLGRGSLTAERFLPHPCGRRTGERLYRTGDLVRWLPDGELEFLGRIDQQVKIRGFRVEPGEIEALLAGHPAVRAAVVVPARANKGKPRYAQQLTDLDGTAGGTRHRRRRLPLPPIEGAGSSLVAYVVVDPASRGALPAVELRAYLRRQLPDYMVPTAFVELGELPRTPSGKVDRRSLPASGRTAPSPASTPPRSPVEEMVAEIWGRVLGCEGVGAGDDFFELGGHSLLATRVASQVRRSFGVELPIRALFEEPTVARFAAYIERALSGGGRRERGSGGEGSGRGSGKTCAGGGLPLSFAQERLWFLDQLDPASPAYNIPGAFHLAGPLDQTALAEAFHLVVERHEILRTSFPSRGGQARQLIAAVSPPLGTVDLRRLPEHRRAVEARRLTSAEATRPFDLARGPVIRLNLLRLGAERHLLLLNMHHIVSDGWSLEVLLRELANGYAALSQGKRPEWPELPIQYADFAVWQRRWIRGEVLEAQLAYWRRQLADVERLRLPTDRPRPAVPSHRGGVHRRVLPADRVAALETLGRRRGASRFMTLLAAFLALLHRTTGQRQVVVGAPVANRHHRETEGLVGCFVNALVLQGDFAGDPGFPRRGTNGGFPELLDRVREMALGAYAHQDLPFEKLVEALAPERDLRRNPLFQVSFGLLRDPASELDLPGLTVHRAELAHPAARFDLSGYLREADDGLRLELLYRTELFDATTIARLAGHFESLVRAAAAHPELRVGELPLWTPPQRHQVLAEWNDHRTRFSGAGCLHELFTAQAEITPEAVAVVEKRRAFSYGELDRLSERLARHLRGLGVGPETRVAIHLERSCELVIAILAVLKAGGAWVPLDPAHPAERLTFLLDDAGVTVLVTRVARTRAWGSSPGDDGGLKSLHPLPSAHLVLVLARAKARASGLVEPPQALPLPPLDKATSLACVFYTSGSTGRPKGVLVSHRALVNRLLWGQDAYPLSPSDRVLQLAASGFDFSIWEIFAPLAAGARLVLAAAGEERDPPGLAQTIARSGVTVVHFVPALLRAFLGAGESVACTSLKRVFCGGEALPAELAERFFAHLDAELWNQYGPTEAAIDATFQRCRPGSPVSIGRPIANAEVWVLDAHQRPVPIGVAGEIALGGAGLSRGYQRRPALTAERFVPHPFTAGARLYRTGDLGRRLADGTLEFLGRRDHQVKIRGIRIELGEIEALLREHPSVTDAVVVDRETSPNMRQLVSCFTSRDPAPASAELRAFLERFLPASMLPSAFAHLDELPRTAQGKVDRAAAGRSAPDHSGARVAPRTPLEELVAEIWTEVLEVTEIGAYDNFFALGGHSLLATRVTSRLRRACRVELPVRVLFERPTVAELAGALAATRGTPTELPPLKRTPFGATIPLSFAQERLWFLEQLEPGSLAYSMPSAWRLTGELDVGALEEAFRCIAERHEVLRTTFLSVDGEPRQVIAPKSDVALPIVDLRRSKIRPSAAGLGGGALSPGRESTRMPEIIPPGERVGVRGFLPRLLREEALRPFDLARGPLLRLTLLRLADRDHVLLLNLHHIISDGWSTGVLHRELATLYEAFASRRPSPLAPLPVRYVDFAVWQRQWLRGRLLEVQLDYWRRQLRGLPEPELPTDRPRPPEPSYRGAGCRLELGPELTRRLRELSRRSGGTLYMTLLAAFFTLLHRLTGERDLAAGTPIANRRHPEIEGLIGFFVNTLVMRGDLSSDPTFAELLDRVRETALDAYAHQDVPFEKLVEALAPERDLARHPLFQVLFTLQNAPRPAVELPGLTLGPLDFGVAAARFDQEWHLWEDAGSLHALVVYSRDLFDASTAARLGRHFATLLAAAAGDPERPLASLPLLESAERHQLEAEWNDTRTAVPAGTVLELWRAQAERTPDVVAVVCGASALSYRRLDREANRLARRLRELGVGPDVPVALSCERSPAMAVAVLGVLQAGGVCVPVDPAYPRERRAFLLADCGAPVLLRVARANDANGDAHHQPSFPGPQAVDVMKFALVCPGENQGQGVAPAEAGGISGHHQRPVEISQALPLPPLGMRVFPENLVYLLYTSGSTGRPKGVAMRHGALSNLILWQRRRSRPGARTLQFASLSFDVSFQEILATWTSGGTLVLIPEALRRDPEALLAYLATTGVERLFLPFVALAQLAEAADRQGTLPRTLREVITAGEALQATPAIRRLFARLGHAGLDNQYGPSETHVVTAHPLAGAPRAWPALPPIGRPVANARIHLLDARLRPVGVGVTAELHIGGEALARGYWRRPALTAERFVPDPWSEEPGVRLYRTGDLARYRPDGTLEFVGRRDDQVKIRGYRIEPGEIEAVLAEHPAVAEAVVTVYARPARLVAFLVPRRRGDGRDLGDVHRWLGARLPEHMIPADFIVLERLPLTASGKVDRRSLPAPAGASRDPGTPYVGPRSPVEEVVAETWSEVLGAPDIGVRDDFFARGGHSLLAVRMMARIEARLGVHLPLATLFRRPTVEGLAAAVADPRPATRSPLVEIQPTGSGSRFFCVHPGGGNVLCYAGLARRLGMDQPFYGLQSRAQDGGKDRDEDVGSMAASYLKAIRAVQPQGPYLLGGWSMGGAVAFEMARRLRSAGQEVALLALIDAAVPPRPAARNREEEATNLVHFARHLGLPSSPALGRDAFLELGGDEGLRRILDQARQADLLPELDLPRMRYLYRRFTSHARAMRRYRPRPYPGKIVLFRPQARTAADSGDPTLGWSELAHDGVELCSVPGDHFTMLREPHVQVLAERLRPLLRNGQD